MVCEVESEIVLVVLSEIQERGIVIVRDVVSTSLRVVVWKGERVGVFIVILVVVDIIGGIEEISETERERSGRAAGRQGKREERFKPRSLKKPILASETT